MRVHGSVALYTARHDFSLSFSLSQTCAAIKSSPCEFCIQGVMDVTGASPRRRFFHMLSNFADAELECERLLYFASAEGRDDLYQ